MVNRFKLENCEMPVNINAGCERESVHLLASHLGEEQLSYFWGGTKQFENSNVKKCYLQKHCVVFALSLANFGLSQRLKKLSQLDQ